MPQEQRGEGQGDVGGEAVRAVGVARRGLVEGKTCQNSEKVRAMSGSEDGTGGGRRKPKERSESVARRKTGVEAERRG